MEDAHTAVLDVRHIDLATYSKDTPSGTLAERAALPKENVAFFAVYDGHGGKSAAIFAGQHLHELVACQDSFAKGNYALALKDGFLSTDESLIHDHEFQSDPSGCTATTAIIADDRIYVANAGDSRTVLGVKGVAKALSFDHKPTNEGERARIFAAGGFVEAGRVNGNLALSRAIGDFDYKRRADLPPEEQIVTVFPDVMQHTFSPDDEFVVLACDGIWDCMHSQEVVEFVRRGIVERQDLDYICENIMENCLAPASDMSGLGCDNMTIMIVALLNGKTQEEWYDMIAERVAKGEGPVAPPESAEAKAHMEPPEVTRGPVIDLSQRDSMLSLQELLGQAATITDENGVLVFQNQARMAAALLGDRPAENSNDSGIEAAEEIPAEEEEPKENK